jgi:hypothetical protein
MVCEERSVGVIELSALDACPVPGGEQCGGGGNHPCLSEQYSTSGCVRLTNKICRSGPCLTTGNLKLELPLDADKRLRRIAECLQQIVLKRMN